MEKSQSILQLQAYNKTYNLTQEQVNRSTLLTIYQKEDQKIFYFQGFDESYKSAFDYILSEILNGDVYSNMTKEILEDKFTANLIIKIIILADYFQMDDFLTQLKIIVPDLMGYHQYIIIPHLNFHYFS